MSNRLRWKSNSKEPQSRSLWHKTRQVLNSDQPKIRYLLSKLKSRSLRKKTKVSSARWRKTKHSLTIRSNSSLSRRLVLKQNALRARRDSKKSKRICTALEARRKSVLRRTG